MRVVQGGAHGAIVVSRLLEDDKARTRRCRVDVGKWIPCQFFEVSADIFERFADSREVLMIANLADRAVPHEKCERALPFRQYLFPVELFRKMSIATFKRALVLLPFSGRQPSRRSRSERSPQLRPSLH